MANIIAFSGGSGGASSGPSKVFESGTTAPSDTSIFWVDTSSGSVLKYYNGTDWTPVSAVFG